VITYEDSSEQRISALYPQNGNLSNYLAEVRNGGKLLVLDPGLPLGFFGHDIGLREGPSANLSSVESGGSLQMQLNSTSGREINAGSGTVLMSYQISGGASARSVPLLVEKRMGAGTLYWAQFGPLLWLVDHRLMTLSQASSILHRIIMTISPEPGTHITPAFDAALRGNVTIAGQSIVSGAEVMPLLLDHNFNISGVVPGASVNYNVTRVDGKGMAWSATSSSSAVIIPIASPGLVEVTYPKGVTFFLNPSPGSPVVIGALANEGVTNLTVSSQVSFTTSEKVSLLAASPAITVRGVLNSSGILVPQKFYAKVGAPPYGLSLEHPYTSFAVIGNITVRGATFGDAFIVRNLTGDWKTVDPNPVKSWQMTGSDWIDLIGSPLGVAMLFAVIVAAALDLARSRKDGR
jgi:hypothetical protein